VSYDRQEYAEGRDENAKAALTKDLDSVSSKKTPSPLDADLSKVQDKVQGVYKRREILEVASMGREALCPLKIQWRLGIDLVGQK
jgi:hypothetical protein